MTNGNLDRAIRQRWIDQNLHAAFKAYWADPLEARFSPFNFAEARPNQGSAYMPYCVFESMGGPPPTRSTGKSGEATVEIEYRTVPAQFVVHATDYTNQSNQKSSGKEICDALGRLIIAAYQDSAGPLVLDGGDCHIQTLVGQDVCRRNDDDVWEWVFPFEFQIERRRTIDTSR